MKQWSQKKSKLSSPSGKYSQDLPDIYQTQESILFEKWIRFQRQETATHFDLEGFWNGLFRDRCLLMLKDIPDEGIPELYKVIEEVYEYYNNIGNDEPTPLPEGEIMLTAHDVAEYYLALANEEEGDLITNLKLQKLLYYAQGFSLAIFDKPLFSEIIEAWTHGPVVPAIYHEYKRYGNRGIPQQNIDFDRFDDETKELLDEVYEVYGQFSAWMLRNLTHDEPPWRDTPSGTEIAHKSLKEYFLTQIN